MAVLPSTASATARPPSANRPIRRSAGPGPVSSVGANSVPRGVAIRVYGTVTLLGVAGAAGVFNVANRFGPDYRIVLLSPTGEDMVADAVFARTAV